MANKSIGNVTVTYNAHSLTAYLSQQTLEAVVNEIDTTNLASTNMEKISGLTDWNITIGGQWSATLDGYLAPDSISPPVVMRTLIVTIGPTGSQAIYTWTTNAFISNFRIEATDPKGLIAWSGKLAVSGPPVRTTG